MAEGPALKVFHSIFTPDPSAFSNQPFAFPAMPWGCVMFGNTPTRITVCALTGSANAANSTTTRRARLFIFRPRFLTVDYKRQNARLLFRFFLFALAVFFALATHDVSQRGVFENTGGGIAYIKEHLVQRAMVGIAVNQAAQLFRIAERRQRTIDKPNDLGQRDFVWRTAELISALSAAGAFHDARVLEFEKDKFEKFFRQVLFVSDIADANRPLVIMTRQHHGRLQRVQSFLRDLHGWYFGIKSI